MSTWIQRLLPSQHQRMARNTSLGLGCRTVFASTLEDLGSWWQEHRDQLPVMAYFLPGLSLLPDAPDGMAECEWVAGPTVEAVVATMLHHLAISTEAVWRDGRWDGSDWIGGCWEMVDLERYQETVRDACLLDDERLSATAAESALLRLFPACDQELLRLFIGAEFDEFLKEELVMRGEGLDEFYGCRAASLAPPRTATRDHPAPRIPRDTDLADGCRSVFLPTLSALHAWYSAFRERYPTMGYYSAGSLLLEQAPDGNEECEFVVGPSVERVTGKMLRHLGIDTRAEITAPEEAENGDESWELVGLRASDGFRTAAAGAAITDIALTAAEAEARMLRHVAVGDQDVLHVWSAEKVTEFISYERGVRDAGGQDYYGVQNEV